MAAGAGPSVGIIQRMLHGQLPMLVDLAAVLRGRPPRSTEQAVIAAAESLLELPGEQRARARMAPAR